MIFAIETDTGIKLAATVDKPGPLSAASAAEDLGYTVVDIDDASSILIVADGQGPLA